MFVQRLFDMMAESLTIITILTLTLSNCNLASAASVQDSVDKIFQSFPYLTPALNYSSLLHHEY